MELFLPRTGWRQLKHDGHQSAPTAVDVKFVHRGESKESGIDHAGHRVGSVGVSA